MIRKVTCPGCGAELELKGGLMACETACPACGYEFAVPAASVGPGITVGGFTIEKLINVGGMGKLFLARQLSMDRRVALKILPAQFCADPENVARFLNEVRMAARLQHPNIVSAYEAGTDEGIHYLAMQYIEGESLVDRIAVAGPLAEREALRIGRKVAAALAYGWDEHQILHRDVKPENILLDLAGEPRLVDMGLSKRMTAAAGMTTAGTVMGTPNYMSPEQISAPASADSRADMFSLGATLYHALTGQVPFEGKTVVQVFQHMATETLPDPRTVTPAISRHCVDLLCVMLARAPEERHQNWQSLMADLDRVVKRFPIKAPVPKSHATLIGGPGLTAGAGASARKHTVHIKHAELEKYHDRTTGKHNGHASKTHHPHPPPRKSFPLLPIAVAVTVIIGILLTAMVASRRQERQRQEAAVRYAQARRAALRKEVMAAVTQARSHPLDYDATRVQLLALETRLVGTEFEGRAAAELQRIEKVRRQAKNAAWDELQGKTDLLFAAGKTEESLALLRDYDGEFADLLGSQRAARLELLRRRAQRKQDTVARLKADAVQAARIRLDQLVEASATGLFAGRCADVLRRVRAADSGGGLQVIAAQSRPVCQRIAAVADVDGAILKSFKSDMGHRISVGLQGGVERLRIRNVAGDQVVCETSSDSGSTVLRRFGVSDLDARERYTRAGKDGTEEGLIRQGLVAGWAQAYDSAVKCFQRVDCPLAKALIVVADAEQKKSVSRLVVPDHRRRQEAAAKAEYKRIMRAVRFTSSGDGPEEDTDAILAMTLSKLAHKKLKNDLRAFKRQHGKTAFAKRHAPLVDAVIADVWREPTDAGARP